MQAIQIAQHGGPEVLELKTVNRPVFDPSSPEHCGQVLVKTEAIGVNFIDTYMRSGLYPFKVPGIPGQESSGVVVAVGDAVSGLCVGDRVAGMGPAQYAQYVVLEQTKACKLPNAITCEQGAAALLQGMTALSLVRLTYRVEPGDWVLVHAGAGGTGGLLVQLCHHFGAKVIATVSTPAKAAIAKAHGADHVIQYTMADTEQEVKRLTQGNGVQVVYDGVGKATFMASIAAAAQNGRVVVFGNTSGKVDPIDVMCLTPKNLTLARPSLFGYIAEPSKFADLSLNVFLLMSQGHLCVTVGKTYPLADAAQAHRDLQSGKTTGKLLLIP
ncbi:hypothetical protein H4R34_003051 [Dimargaris verticillata]|uniref:Probable quinone oxidoreductase n=1 Tax=Dimargaris verticillata TaxID=2761393 RepID=A0A9W8B0Q1_9FUNG|nr:hypothetical protein H4R34_003051 [Dimargaris verticillata]